MKILLLLALAISFTPLLAEDLTPEQMKALQDTQQMLRDPNARKDAAKKNQGGESALHQADGLAGSPEDQAALYDLAADIMGNLAKDAKGDPEKMMELLEKAKKDPNAFGNQFTPAQKKKLKDLADKIESKNHPL